MKKVMALVAVLSSSNMAMAGNCGAEGAISIKDIAGGDPATFGTLVAAAAKAELLGFLDGNRNLTVFAPTNDAFDATAENVLGEGNDGLDLVEALGKDALTDILKYHIAAGERYSSDVLSSRKVRMLNRDFTFPSSDGGAFINDSEITMPDVPACNGVVHVIDGAVLLPSD